MSDSFKNILVAVAGYTDPATGKRDSVLETVMERNIRYACNLAKDTGSKLTLIHVTSMPTMLEPSFVMNFKVFEEAGRKILEVAKKIARDMGMEAGTIWKLASAMWLIKLFRSQKMKSSTSLR